MPDVVLGWFKRDVVRRPNRIVWQSFPFQTWTGQKTEADSQGKAEVSLSPSETSFLRRIETDGDLELWEARGTIAEMRRLPWHHCSPEVQWKHWIRFEQDRRSHVTADCCGWRRGSSQISADSPANSVTVTGSGQVSYTPNEALLDLSVVTEAATASNATRSKAAAIASVLRALEAIGVSNSSIQTRGYTLYTDYSNTYSSTSVPQILAYAVTNSLTMNLTEGSPTQLGLKVGQAIDASVSAGANQVNLQFTASNALLGQLNNQALA